MGSHSYIDNCPKCDKNTFACCEETRSLHHSGECFSCGFYIFTQEGQLNKSELEELKEVFEVAR